MTRTFIAGVVSILFLFTWSACDGGNGDNGDVPSQTATFEATVSGAVEGEISGTAFSAGAGGGAGWGLTLAVVAPKTSSGLDASITIIRAMGDRPGEGTYSILGVPDEESNDFYAGAVIGNGAYSATQGNLQITSSSGSNVRGTFGFDASDGTQTITIEGGFNATNVEGFGN